jgi:hypothetical protein
MTLGERNGGVSERNATAYESIIIRVAVNVRNCYNNNTILGCAIIH